MIDAGLFIGWNRPVPGREAAAVELFDELTKYFERLKSKGEIESYEPVILSAHGGDMNGFFLLRGESSKIENLRGNRDFQEHVIRASIMLLGFGVVRTYVGEGVHRILSLYSMAH
jgi:hypothetical protein